MPRSMSTPTTNAFPIPHQGRPARRLPCARQRSSARQHGHVAWTISAHRHRPGRHGRSGKLWVIESLAGRVRFNDKFRDECLSLEWFRSRAEAKVVIEAWRRHYTEVRPHSSLGYLTPVEFVTKLKKNDAAPASATGRDAAV